MKIVVLDGFTTNPGDLSWNPLEVLGDLKVYDRTSESLLLERSEGAEILLTNKTRLSEKHFELLPDLKLICVMATGYDVVDIQAAKTRGILVTNVRGYSTPSVVQHTFALILELLNRTGHHASAVREGRWNQSPDFSFWDRTIYELEGKRMGLVGLGAIGKAVATVASAFGMDVVATRKDMTSSETGVELMSAEELFSTSDIVSLHCPLTDENYHLVNAELIGKMNSTALLINTARGGLVDLKALEAALEEGSIAGAGLDVLEKEPPLDQLEILRNKNCVVTPHQAWASLESRQRLIDGLVENIKGYVSGQPINVVNADP